MHDTNVKITPFSAVVVVFVVVVVIRLLHSIGLINFVRNCYSIGRVL